MVDRLLVVFEVVACIRLCVGLVVSVILDSVMAGLWVVGVGSRVMCRVSKVEKHGKMRVIKGLLCVFVF